MYTRLDAVGTTGGKVTLETVVPHVRTADMAGGSITGVVGHVAWAHHVAASLTDYTVTRSGTDWTLRGTVVKPDPFKLLQRPLLFVAPHQGGDWRWLVETWSIEGTTFRATLGPPL